MATLTASLGSALYSSLTSLVRYVYVRSSLVENVQYILKKDSFKVRSVLFAESLLTINIAYLYYHVIQPRAPKSPLKTEAVNLHRKIQETANFNN